MILVLFWAAGSCTQNGEIKPAYLVEATPFLKRSANELKTFMAASGLDVDPSLLKHDVELFKVTYRTTYKSAIIEASGIVILPAANESLGIISFQHGTIVHSNDAPTRLPLNDTELILYAALSSTGLVTVIPDYIGFGASDGLLHPYYVEEATADAVRDNIQAAGELAGQEGLSLNRKLFLAGYSEGGYATLATHKSIEEEPLSGYDLIASFPASGGYDIKGMQEYFFLQTTYDQPYYLAYVALSYKTHYDWPEPLSDYFREPYAGAIPSLFNGTKSASEINAALTDQVPDLLQADLLQHIDTNPRYANLVTAFNENSLLDWIPRKKIYLYHGTDDITVPYQNSVDTYNTLINGGTSPSVLTFTPLQGADHGSGIFPYVEQFIPLLLSLK